MSEVSYCGYGRSTRRSRVLSETDSGVPRHAARRCPQRGHVQRPAERIPARSHAPTDVQSRRNRDGLSDRDATAQAAELKLAAAVGLNRRPGRSILAESHRVSPSACPRARRVRRRRRVLVRQLGAAHQWRLSALLPECDGRDPWPVQREPLRGRPRRHRASRRQGSRLSASPHRTQGTLETCAVAFPARLAFELSTAVPADFRPSTYTVEVRVDNPSWTHEPPASGCLQAGGPPTGYECRATTVSVLPPPEGYVHRAYVSRVRDGSPVHRIANTSKEAWARFEFWLNPVTDENALPRRGARLSVAWRQPGGRRLAGSMRRPSKYVIVSQLRSARPLRRGVWSVLLRADAVTVKRLAFSVQ
jgi:hypothetical protein